MCAVEPCTIASATFLVPNTTVNRAVDGSEARRQYASTHNKTKTFTLSRQGANSKYKLTHADTDTD